MTIPEETFAQRMARLSKEADSARGVDSSATSKNETLDQRMARLAGSPAPVAEATGTRSPAQMAAAGFTSLMEPFTRLAKPAPNLPPETRGERIAGAISAGYQGLTMGAGNKITAGIRTVLPEPIGGVKGFDFPTALNEQTQVLDEYKQRHPLEALAMEGAGSIPTIAATEGLLGVKALGEGSSGLARAAQLASAGAKYGATSGALGSNDLASVVPNMFSGAATGAVLAPVVGPTVGAALRAGNKVLSRALPNAADQLPLLTGESATPAQSKTDELLRSTLRSGGVDPANVRVVSPQQTILDLGSVPTMRAVRAATNNPLSTAGQDVTTFLKDRASEAGQRIRTILSDVTGYKPESFNQTVEQLNAAKSATAKPLYADAMADPPIPTTVRAEKDAPSLGELFQRPSIQRAVKYNNSLVAESGGTPISMPGVPEQVANGNFSPEQWTALVKANPSLGTSSNAEVSMETLHNVKIRLDEMIGFARANGHLPDGTPATRKMLSAINDTRVQLLKIMDTARPKYAVARSTYAGDAASTDAYKAGRAFFSSGGTASDGASELASLSPAEQDMWRRGGMTWLHDNLNKLATNPDLPHAGRNVNIIQRLFGSEHAGDRAKLLFGDKAAYDKFVEAAGPEGNFPAVKNFFTGQSTTASQLAESAPSDWKWGVYHGAKVLSGGPAAGYHAIGVASHLTDKLFPPGMSLDVANELGARAKMTGPELRSLLDRIGNMPDPVARKAALNRLAGSSASVGAGLLREISPKN